LVGEAAGWISPSSAEGLSYAFRSALALAASLAGGPEGFLARYRAATFGLRRNILFKNLKSPAMYLPPLRRAILAAGIGSVPVIGEKGLHPSVRI
ncbi:MAG: colicin M resistance protein CbrA, partial [Firmicutes bacterium]|nr:colicin M resistance protein CbrA [Bacillota bacterium]